MKMWAGRFKENLNEKVNEFNSSISFDARLYREDILGSIAHCTMLHSKNIISLNEKEQIINGLSNILEDIENGKLLFNAECEDIHMFIEQELTSRIGVAGKKLHTARSRNDQVALDARMYHKKEILNIISLSKDLISVLCNMAEQHKDTIMPGYTHLQRAQPISFAHHLLAYAQMIRRDISRLNDCYGRTDDMPLGSGALATTTYEIDRQEVASLLKFSGVTSNSLDSVSDRDFVIELASCLSILMMHLSRFSEEIILWSSFEFKFIELSDAYSTGSSIMPQKKNPDIAELVRGKTGRVYGDLITLLTLMKGLPLSYNKDMQEAWPSIFDAVDTTKLCLDVFTPMLATITVNKENMKKAAEGGFINATDCADYLVKKGMAFRDAYKVVGELVAHCIDTGNTLNSLELNEYKNHSPLFDNDIYDAISLYTCLNERRVYGGPSVLSIERQIMEIKNEK